MSRAFTKERDDEPVEPSLLQRAAPLVLTVRGARRFRERIAAGDTSEADRRDLETRLAAATIVELPEDRSRVALGAVVTVRGVGRGNRVFEVVSEDEVDIERGRIGAESPLGAALLGKRVGESAIWERPIGDKAVTIIGIEYEWPRDRQPDTQHSQDDEENRSR